MSKEIKVLRGVLSYPSIFQARAAVPGGTEKFGTSIILDLDNTDHARQVKEINAAAKAVIAEDLKGKKPGNTLPMHKGWEKYPDDPFYERKVILSTYSTEKPVIVDAQMNDIVDKSVFYPGCVCNFSLAIYAYRKPITGLAFGLNGVQWIANGEPLGNRKSKSQMFGTVDDAELPDAVPSAESTTFEEVEDDDNDWM